jgi:hypothetical protein
MATIADIRAVGTPQKAYEFEVTLRGANSIEILTQRVMNASVPESSVETIEINYKGRKTIYPGRDASPHTTVVTFWDTESHELYNFFRGWMDKISNPLTGVSTSRDKLVSELVIKRLAADSATVTGTNILTNVFPTAVGEITLNYESSDHISFDVTFSYDENTLPSSE